MVGVPVNLDQDAVHDLAPNTAAVVASQAKAVLDLHVLVGFQRDRVSEVLGQGPVLAEERGADRGVGGTPGRAENDPAGQLGRGVVKQA